MNDAKLIDDGELVAAGTGRAGRARRGRDRGAHGGGDGDCRQRRRRAGAGARDLGGDAAAARDRGQRARRRIPRHLPHRGRRGARHGRRQPRRAGSEDPGDRDALRTVRRQFHTLKGSGRMVGLTELGELAFGVERIHNRLLEEERPATRGRAGDDRAAERVFRAWIASAQGTGSVAADPRGMHAAIRRGGGGAAARSESSPRASVPPVVGRARAPPPATVAAETRRAGRPSLHSRPRAARVLRGARRRDSPRRRAHVRGMVVDGEGVGDDAARGHRVRARRRKCPRRGGRREPAGPARRPRRS